MKISNILENVTSDDRWDAIIKENPVRFNSIKNPSEKLQKIAVHAMAELQGRSWLPAWMCQKLTSKEAQKVAMSYDDKAIFYFPTQYVDNIIDTLWMTEDLKTTLQMINKPKEFYNKIINSRSEERRVGKECRS